MRNFTVMIIEDDKDTASFYDFCIQNLKYESIIAYDGTNALYLLQQTIPDLIILDMHLPDVDGVEILQRLQYDDRLKQVPILVVTGESQTITPKIEKQVQTTLIKPIDHETLTQLITKFAEQKN